VHEIDKHKKNIWLFLFLNHSLNQFLVVPFKYGFTLLLGWSVYNIAKDEKVDEKNYNYDDEANGNL